MLTELLSTKEHILEEIRVDSQISSHRAQFIATSSLHLNEKERPEVYQQVWTNEFIETIMNYTHGESRGWKFLIVGLGNSIAYPLRPFLDRILSLSSFTSFLLNALTLETLDTLQEQESSAFELSIWIIANILQGLEGQMPESLEPIIPLFLQMVFPQLRSQGLLTPDTSTNWIDCGTPVQLNPQFNGTVLEIRRDQLYLRVFRSLAAIFSSRRLQTSYCKEYHCFIHLLEQSPSFIQALLFEFQLGLEGKKILPINFYPEAYHRALTVSFLAKIPPALQTLVEAGVIPLLGKALFTRFKDSELPTSLLWQRSMKSLSAITAVHHFHDRLRSPEIVSAILFAASFKVSPPKMSLTDRKRAAEIIVMLRIRWEVERLFWIAQRKERSQSCPLHLIPAELIKPIMIQLILFEDAQSYERYTTDQRHGYRNRYYIY